MTSHLLHGLWLKDTGLHLWIEEVSGHKIVTPEAVPAGVFPPAVDQVIRERKFRHRVRTDLITPKGRAVTLNIPSLALPPEQAVSALAAVAAVGPDTATCDQAAAIAADLSWLGHLYLGLRRLVEAGRVSFRLRYRDRQWWPTWQLALGLAERSWLAGMTAAAPGVLTRNCGLEVAEDVAEELPHWIVHSLTAPLRERTRPTPWHDFPEALLQSTPLRKGTSALVAAINKWKDSITGAAVDLVLLVESPPAAEHDNPLWPVRVQARSGTDAPLPIRRATFDSATLGRLGALVEEAALLAPVLLRRRGRPGDPTIQSLASAPQAGEWDCYLTTDELAHFVRAEVPALRRRGISVLLPKSWSTGETKASLRVRETTGGQAQSKLGMERIVAFDWKISVGDRELSDREMAELVESKSGLINLRGSWVMADADALRRVRDYVGKLQAHNSEQLKEQRKHIEMMLELARSTEDEVAVSRWTAELELLQAQEEEQHLSIAQLRRLRMEEELDALIELSGSEWAVRLAGGLGATVENIAPTTHHIPSTVQAELRHYQQRGVDWLLWMADQGLGAILADDMGLGKTLQVLVVEAIERERGQTQPTLVVAPTSVVENWAKEAATFVPHLKVHVHHGSSRYQGRMFTRTAQRSDLVITSYGTATRDVKMLAGISWRRVVLDEAQHIKNSSTKTSKSVRAIPADHRIALTGTPVENHLLELRSLMDFCNPGILGSAQFFKHRFAKPIEFYGNEEVKDLLHKLTHPFILRRLKADPAIIQDLPEKEEITLYVELSAEQAALYTAYVADLREKIESSEGIQRRGQILASLTKIKQICNHPAHFLDDGSAIKDKSRHRSGKIEQLETLITQARSRGEKVLLFTQYRKFGDMLVPYLTSLSGQEVPFLHGGVSRTAREAMVETFQGPDGPAVMLLSLKAGGTGLNLTNASIVVHLDRWWNPAVENQATDRAYRIGQTKDVTVYKFISVGTMEERIHEIISAKKDLAEAMITQGEGWITELSDAELAELLTYQGEE